jgi:hypothetical protein
MNRAEPRRNDEALADALDPWSLRARHLVAMRLAAARAHAEAGRLDSARGCLIALRVGLVGEHPDDEGGLLRNARAAFYRHNLDRHRPGRDRAAASTAHGEATTHLMPIVDRNDWLQASQLSGQAISELHVAVAMDSCTSPQGCSPALAAWERRHRDRVGRWVRSVLGLTESSLDHAFGRKMVKSS